MNCWLVFLFVVVFLGFGHFRSWFLVVFSGNLLLESLGRLKEQCICEFIDTESVLGINYLLFHKYL